MKQTKHEHPIMVNHHQFRTGLWAPPDVFLAECQDLSSQAPSRHPSISHGEVIGTIPLADGPDVYGCLCVLLGFTAFFCCYSVASVGGSDCWRRMCHSRKIPSENIPRTGARTAKPGQMDIRARDHGYGPLGQATEHLSTPWLMDLDTGANGYAPLGQAPEYLSTPGLMDIGTGANWYAPLGHAPGHIPCLMGIVAGANGYAPLGQAPEPFSTQGLVIPVPSFWIHPSRPGTGAPLDTGGKWISTPG